VDDKTAKKLGDMLNKALGPEMEKVVDDIQQTLGKAITGIKERSRLPNFVILVHLAIAMSDAIGICAGEVVPKNFNKKDAEAARKDMLDRMRARAESSMRMSLAETDDPKEEWE